jgi:hypothetical protein
MLGIEASSSIRNEITAPVRGGAISDRNTAAPIPNGTASRSAIPEVTSVPTT